MGIALPKRSQVGWSTSRGLVGIDLPLPLSPTTTDAVWPQVEVVKDWSAPAFVESWQALYDRAVQPSPIFDPSFMIPYLASHRNSPSPVMISVVHRVDGHTELLALMLIANHGRNFFKSLFQTPDITQLDIGKMMFCEPLLTPDQDVADRVVEALFKHLYLRRPNHARLMLKGLRSSGAVSASFVRAAERCGLAIVSVNERSPTHGLDFEPSARNLPIQSVTIANTLDTLKPALERMLAIDALSGDIDQEPLVHVTGMAIFLRALVRSMSDRQRIRIAMIDTESVQIAALAIETETETFLWRVSGRDRSNPLLEAALSAAIQMDSGKELHAATDAPLSGLGLKPLPLTSLRIDFDGMKGMTG